ncbi:DUF881 domain-containing protein [Polymorphospora sp. A560]
MTDHPYTGSGWLSPRGSGPSDEPTVPLRTGAATPPPGTGPSGARPPAARASDAGDPAADEPTVPLRPAAGTPILATGAPAGGGAGDPDERPPAAPAADPAETGATGSAAPGSEPPGSGPAGAGDAPGGDRPVGGEPPAGGPGAVAGPSGDGAPKRGISSAGATIAVLLLLLGFTMAVQLKNNSTDSGLTAARQEDLVRILSDLENSEERLRQEIAALEESQRQLSSGAAGREAALEEATRRGDDLGILAGTLPARGPGLSIQFSAGGRPVKASAILDAVQELRGAGAEAMQITGGDGASVRIVASTYFVEADGRIDVDGRRLPGPHTITVIGDPQTMLTALNIPGGVVASVTGDGGNVTVQEHEVVDVAALSEQTDLQYARPGT